MRLGPGSGAHRRVRLHSHHAFYIVLVSSSLVEAGDWVNKFTVTCKTNVLMVINGTQNMGDITNTTIWGKNYIYNGTARELKSSYPREDYLTLTYPGMH
jgi:hypothetical protein